MTHEQFIMWLHGFFEISGAKELNETQTQVIKDHLNLFFKKETPDRELELIENNPLISPTSKCTCGIFNSIWCPVHGPKVVSPPFPNNPNEIIC